MRSLLLASLFALLLFGACAPEHSPDNGEAVSSIAIGLNRTDGTVMTVYLDGDFAGELHGDPPLPDNWDVLCDPAMVFPAKVQLFVNPGDYSLWILDRIPPGVHVHVGIAECVSLLFD